MKLKNIKIQGFKSFDDLTQIDFHKEITCIVGPNGCGKSNVVDAIRWVMGEQSAKHLRGKSMEDIIFVGSQMREASSLASVEITFEKDGALLPPQYDNCAEISIGRKLYRTGESEYFINKQNVRLKDITDIFLGTGIGSKAYSIIEQGRVEQLITAKPEERRYIIEEAAGISKFKSRKDAALRRMEATNTNLSRLKDIILELERQISSLDRQAKKAKRFAVIRDELRDLDLKLSSLTFEKFNAEQEKHLTVIKNSDAQIVDLNNDITLDEAWVDEHQLLVAEVETALNDLQQKVYEWDNCLRLAESKLQARKDEQQRFETEKEASQQNIFELEQNLTGNQNGLCQINEKLCVAEQDCVELTDLVEEQEQILQVLESSSQQLFETLEQAREEHNRSSHQLIQLSSRRESVQQRIHDISEKQEHDERELETLTEKHRKLERLLKDTHKDLSGIKQLKLTLGEQTENLAQTLQQEQTQVALEKTELETLKEELLRKKSRLQSLQELERNFEGYHEGPRNILRKKRAGEMGAILGSVADFVEVDKQYEDAVAAVLGENMQTLVVSSQREGIACAEYLKSSTSGRGSFLALSLVTANESVCDVSGVQNMNAAVNVLSHHYLDMETDTVVTGLTTEPSWQSSSLSLAEHRVIQGKGVKGYLKDVVTMKAGYEHLSKLLFGDVILAESLKDAFESWVAHKKAVVTYDGEFISAQGILTGGTLENTSKSLLEKKREMKVLDEVIQNLVNQVSEKEITCQELESKITALKTELKQIQTSSHEEDLRIANQEKDVLHFNRDMESLNAQRGKLSERIFQTKQQLEKETLELERIHREEAEQKQVNENAVNVLNNRKSEEEVSRLELTSRQEALTKAKINLARAREQKAYLLQETERLIAEEVRLQREIIRIKERCVYLEHRLSFTQDRVQFLDKYIQKIVGQKEAVDQLYRDTKNNYEKMNAQLREREHELKNRQRHYNQLKDDLNLATVKLTEIRAELSRVNELILERYQLVLSEIYQEHKPAEDNFDVHQVREQTDDLRRKLTNIGSVNLGAIEELTELQTRFDFLSAQKQDLEASLNALDRAIHKINRTTKKRFQDTFERVNDKFTKLFPRLFKGGHAYLALTDPENILETGVDIIAQPPGKKLQSVSLLSGGEKALTAISLLFAIFLIKPSPFCLLDEVDAPLDDANVDRYNEIVRELSQKTQFIVITHNKRTMQATNCLFGVTMQEGGVSKVVSVSLDD